MQKRQIKAAEYRARALDASTNAATSLLDRVREKHQIAADRWSLLAALNERDAASPDDGRAVLQAPGAQDGPALKL